MLIEATVGLALAAAIVIFLAPDEIAGRLAAVLSLLPLGGSLLMWLNFDASGNGLLA